MSFTDIASLFAACVLGTGVDWLLRRSLRRELAQERAKNAVFRDVINEQRETIFQLWLRSTDRPSLHELYGNISGNDANSQGRN